MEKEETKKGGEIMKRRLGKKVLIGALCFVLLIAIGTSGYFYYQYQQIKKNPQQAGQKEANSVVQKISKYMDLPKDEQPTLATVTDTNKLKNQAFFTKAINGDKLLIFTKAKKAILYRPSTERVIEFAPLIMDTAPTAPPPKAENTQPSATTSGKVRQ